MARKKAHKNFLEMSDRVVYNRGKAEGEMVRYRFLYLMFGGEYSIAVDIKNERLYGDNDYHFIKTAYASTNFYKVLGVWEFVKDKNYIS